MERQDTTGAERDPGEITVVASVEVGGAPARVYESFMAREGIPRFLPGTEDLEVKERISFQVGRWMDGRGRPWGGRILETEEGREVTWAATEGEELSGNVRFEPSDGERTSVIMTVRFRPGVDPHPEPGGDNGPIDDARLKRAAEEALERFRGATDEPFSGASPGDV
jgi:uncharacterized membrane protein